MLLLLFILSTIYASEGILCPLAGTLIDENGKPIENASILVDSLNIGTTTDTSGYFNIMLEAGSYDITFYHIGHENSKIKLTAPTKEIIKLILETRPIKTDELVITSNRQETYIKDTPIITHVITKNDINKSSYSTVKELIEFAMPSIQSTHDNHGEDKIKIQGLDNKYTTFLVDGNKVTGEIAGNIDFSQFNMNNIEKIEVVRGGLSTVYGSGAMGGVVNIIT